MKSEDILTVLKSVYNINWRVSGDRSIGCYKGGYVSYLPIERSEIESIAHYLMKRYEDRKRITMNALDIPPDLSAPTQGELLDKINEGTFWRHKKNLEVYGNT